MTQFKSRYWSFWNSLIASNKPMIFFFNSFFCNKCKKCFFMVKRYGTFLPGNFLRFFSIIKWYISFTAQSQDRQNCPQKIKWGPRQNVSKCPKKSCPCQRTEFDFWPSISSLFKMIKWYFIQLVKNLLQNEKRTSKKHVQRNLVHVRV